MSVKIKPLPNFFVARRELLTSGSGAAVLALASASGWAASVQAAENVPGWSPSAFEAKSLAEVARALGATAAPLESAALTLQAPDLAENGSVVRISARSALAGTTQLALVVEKNPFALAALFEIPAGTDAQVATNLKMAQTSLVYVLAQAGGAYFYAAREIKVTLGGCGA